MRTLGPPAIRQISSISYKEILACTAPTVGEDGRMATAMQLLFVTANATVEFLRWQV